MGCWNIESFKDGYLKRDRWEVYGGYMWDRIRRAKGGEFAKR